MLASEQKGNFSLVVLRSDRTLARSADPLSRGNFGGLGRMV